MDEILKASPGELNLSVGPGFHADFLVDSARALKSLADCIMQHTALVPVSDLLVSDTLKLEATLPSFGWQKAQHRGVCQRETADFHKSNGDRVGLLLTKPLYITDQEISNAVSAISPFYALNVAKEDTDEENRQKTHVDRLPRIFEARMLRTNGIHFQRGSYSIVLKPPPGYAFLFLKEILNGELDVEHKNLLVNGDKASLSAIANSCIDKVNFKHLKAMNPLPPSAMDGTGSGAFNPLAKCAFDSSLMTAPPLSGETCGCVVREFSALTGCSHIVRLSGRLGLHLQDLKELSLAKQLEYIRENLDMTAFLGLR